ncbi:MAG: acyl-CoA dehydrogenase family protein, partial [Myxococcales bacterium]|nr:acyl-CoA dehydrogenase family protein [Myxococcales bacterium]
MSEAQTITDAEREALGDLIRRFVDKEIAPNIDAWEEAGEFPRELY